MQLSNFFLLIAPIIGFSSAQSPSESVSSEGESGDPYASGIIFSGLDSGMIQSMIQSQSLNDTIIAQNGTLISENGTVILQNGTFSGQNTSYPEGGLAGTLIPNGTFAQNGTLGAENATLGSDGSNALGYIGNGTSGGGGGSGGGQNGTSGAAGTMYGNGTFVEGNGTASQRRSSNGVPNFNENIIINGGAIGLIAACLASFLI